MLSQFTTWGDVKEIQRRLESMEFIPLDGLTSPEMKAQAAHKHDDEFFFELSPEMIAQGRQQRWPRVPREGESIRYEVTATAAGKILLLLLVVNDKNYFYRANEKWIYIGPGDDVVGFVGEEFYEVLTPFVSFFDTHSPTDSELTLAMVGPYVANLQDYYLARGLLGYHLHFHVPDSAYLLVTNYSPEGQAETETALFLITDKFWLRRISGAWHEANDYQVVGSNGEFDGSLIAPLLETAAVAWWDSLSAAPSFQEALIYCAAFPAFRFEIDARGRVSGILLETEGGTWASEPAGWKVRHRMPSGHVERQKDIGSFVLNSCQEKSTPNADGAAQGPSQTASEQPMRNEAVRLGLLSLVNPSLIAEAREWVLDAKVDTQTAHDLAAAAIPFLLSVGSAHIVYEDTFVEALVMHAGGRTYERIRGHWSAINEARNTILSTLPRRIEINMDRLPELAAWWDSQANEDTHPELIPHDHAFPKEIYVNAQGAVAGVVDGEREWSKHGEKWSVRPVIEDPEPDYDERLPDWFYNA